MSRRGVHVLCVWRLFSVFKCIVSLWAWHRQLTTPAPVPYRFEWTHGGANVRLTADFLNWGHGVEMKAEPTPATGPIVFCTCTAAACGRVAGCPLAALRTIGRGRGVAGSFHCIVAPQVEVACHGLAPDRISFAVLASAAATVDVLPGKTWSYKYVVDGKWLYDNAAPWYTDAFGNINNMLLIDPDTGLAGTPVIPVQPETRKLFETVSTLASTSLLGSGSSGGGGGGAGQAASPGAAAAVVEAAASGGAFDFSSTRSRSSSSEASDGISPLVPRSKVWQRLWAGCCRCHVLALPRLLCRHIMLWGVCVVTPRSRR